VQIDAMLDASVGHALALVTQRTATGALRTTSRGPTSGPLGLLRFTWHRRRYDDEVGT
jgi:hypothetical protein